ncbi:MAG: Maf family protein [Pseudomonadota bacterium]
MNGEAVILASGSASRRKLLENAGVAAVAIKPNVDEDSAKAAFRDEGLRVGDQAMALAEMKAAKVSAQNAGLVIGGDQMLALGDRAFDKPADLAAAKRHLQALSGAAHVLETAVVVASEGRILWRHHSRPKLKARVLSDAFIDAYVEAEGESLLSTVGAYRLEARGAQLFTSIEGDYFSILGLPLLPLLDYLRTRGVLAA